VISCRQRVGQFLDERRQARAEQSARLEDAAARGEVGRLVEIVGRRLDIYGEVIADGGHPRLLLLGIDPQDCPKLRWLPSCFVSTID